MVKYLNVQLPMILLILKDFSLKVQVACNDHLSHDPLLFVLCHQNFAQNRKKLLHLKLLQYWVYDPIQILFKGEIPLICGCGFLCDSVTLASILACCFIYVPFSCPSTFNSNLCVIPKSSPWPHNCIEARTEYQLCIIQLIMESNK